MRIMNYNSVEMNLFVKDIILIFVIISVGMDLIIYSITTPTEL